MKIRSRGVKYFHTGKKEKEGTEGQTDVTKLTFALQFRYSA